MQKNNTTSHRQVSGFSSKAMDVLVSYTWPEDVNEAEQLLSDHDAFRASLEGLLPEIEGLNTSDESRFEALCDEVTDLLRRIEEHDEREADLLQEVFLRDEGGEGYRHDRPAWNRSGTRQRIHP